MFSGFWCPRVISRELLNGFSLNLILGSFIKVGRSFIILVKINRNITDTLHEHLHEFLGASRARSVTYLSGREMFRTNAEKNWAHILLPSMLSVSLTVYGIIRQGTFKQPIDKTERIRGNCYAVGKYPDF
jgi:hypothetical protein